MRKRTFALQHAFVKYRSSLRLARPLALLGMLWLSSLPVGAAVAEDTAEAQQRPNILFIMSDDHGYQAMGSYGSEVNETPNLDRIAKEGMRFDRAFVTNSICGPCRAVILTGKYSHLNGFVRNGNKFNGEQQNVAKLLQKAGYQTAIVGKWHLGTDPTGFDYWHILQGQGPYYNPNMITAEGRVPHTGYTTDIITDLALDWLKEKREPGKPFFLVYQHKAPHRNWQPGPKYLTKYDDVDIPEPDTLFDDYEGRGTAAREQKMTIASDLNDHDLKLRQQNGRFTEEQLEVWNAAYGPKNEAFRDANLEGDELVRWKYQRYVKDYLRCVDSVDENVGRVLDYLEETGLDENTIVFYTSDQGWYLGEHGWFDKRWMYEESFRTPLLVRWPGLIEPGSENTDMVMNLDFAQTFLDIAGVEAPDDMQGESLVPVFKNETPEDWRDSVYYHYYEFPGAHSVKRHYGVRNERYKLIHFYQIEEWELYDLEEDPHEMRSVYEDEAYQDIVEEMKRELRRLRDYYQDDGSVIDFDAEKARNVPLEQALSFGDRDPVLADGSALLERNSQQLDPSYKPFGIGGWCKFQSNHGVIAAHGGGSLGYSLYVEDGKLKFALRSNGSLETVSGPEIEQDKWVHLVGLVDREGKGHLFVNGVREGEPKQLGFIGDRPAEGFSIGADTGSPVSEYASEMSLAGELRDIRLYWGPLDSGTIQNWSANDDCVSLFNREDLEGWDIIEEAYFEKHGEVNIEDGTVVLGRGKSATGIKLKEAPARMNYEVTLEAKRIEGGDFFCGLTFPVNDDYLTLIVGGWGGGVIGISNLDGMSAVENETTGYLEFEQDRWYAVRLRVTDEQITAWIDGHYYVGIETDAHKHSIWWEQEPARPFGIVSWDTTAALRNLRFLEIE